MAKYVLIVDDAPNIVLSLEFLMKKEGYEVQSVANGEEAMAAIAEKIPDLILLDVVMPGVDGIEVCRRLKEDPATRLIPIIIMTALSDREDRIRGVEAGADDFLTKPVDDRELRARIGMRDAGGSDDEDRKERTNQSAFHDVSRQSRGRIGRRVIAHPMRRRV